MPNVSSSQEKPDVLEEGRITKSDPEQTLNQVTHPKKLEEAGA
jgi:hypothetical protein